MLSPVFLSSLRVGVDTLRANPLRTLLSTLGIIMGVGALVSVLSLGDGVEHYARKQIERTTDLQVINITAQRFRNVDGVPVANAQVPTFAVGDVDDLQRAVGTGNDVALYTLGVALVRTRADTNRRGVQLVGGSAAIQAMRGLTLDKGRFYTPKEGRSGAPVVALSRAAANALVTPATRSRIPPPAGPLTAAAAALVGDTLSFQGHPRTVIGVLSGESDERARLVYMPLASAMEASAGDFGGRPPALAVKVARVEESTETRRRIEQWLTRRYGAWQDRVDVSTNRSRVEQVEQGMLIFKLLMGALTGISLLVGGIGIMNVLLASVVERTREIGIRKATGAQQRHILVQFLCESVAISAAGSVFGVVLGLATSFGVSAIMRARTNAPVYAWVSPSTIVVAVLASVAVGLTFGLYPALRAARLAPIDAIHQE
ncbi:MAG TPA: ABC transporter permease [Gemmatimonadaceae bacterium]|jgi:putative ABC transport system permease protein|nr:ABC transporter permease [Gemmatimonadaceae bacterium]